MEGAATPDFLWAVLTQGAPEESSNGYIVDNKNLSQAWRTDEEGLGFFSFSSHNLWAAQESYRKHPCSPVFWPEDTAWDVHRGLGLLFQFQGMMDYFLCLLPSPAMHRSRNTDLANMNVYVYIYGFRYLKNGWGEGEVYLSTLPSPDAFSICKYLQTAMSGIYVKVTKARTRCPTVSVSPPQSWVEIT